MSERRLRVVTPADETAIVGLFQAEDVGYRGAGDFTLESLRELIRTP